MVNADLKNKIQFRFVSHLISFFLHYLKSNNFNRVTLLLGYQIYNLQIKKIKAKY